MIDSAMAYQLATLYPLVARADLSSLGFAQYPGEVGHRRGRRGQGQAQRAAEAALAGPLDVYRDFFLAAALHRRRAPSIVDIRLAATMEFLKVIDYDFPEWAADYLARMEEALGDAYSEPAADVRGYIEYVKSQQVGA